MSGAARLLLAGLCLVLVQGAHAVTTSTFAPAALATPTSAALAPNWCNRVTLRSAELARENEPGIHMARISPTPLLMIVADRDLLTPTDLCLEAYQRALPPKRLLMLAGGHFTPYIEHFDATSQAAADWFVRHLGEGGEQSATVVE